MNAYRILVVQPEGTKQLGRPRPRCVLSLLPQPGQLQDSPSSRFTRAVFSGAICAEYKDYHSCLSSTEVRNALRSSPLLL